MKGPLGVPNQLHTVESGSKYLEDGMKAMLAYLFPFVRVMMKCTIAGAADYPPEPDRLGETRPPFHDATNHAVRQLM